MPYRNIHKFLKAPLGFHRRNEQYNGVDSDEDAHSLGQGPTSLFAQNIFSPLCVINLCTNAR